MFGRLMILKISTQLTLEMKISGETGSVCKGNPSSEEACAKLGFSWSNGSLFNFVFLVIYSGNSWPLTVG